MFSFSICSALLVNLLLDLSVFIFECKIEFPVISGPFVRFYCYHIKNVPFSCFYLDPLRCIFFFTLKPTHRITRAHLQPACPPSRPPPWAAGAQGFPRVSDWRLDSPSPIRTVITECHLSMLNPFRCWGKTGSWTKQKPPGNPDASSTRSSYLHQYYSPSSGSSGQIEGARGLCSNSNSFISVVMNLTAPVSSREIIL